MKQFRFICTGMAPTSIKKYLPDSCSKLPKLFTLKDILPGMFAPSIMKRLKTNCQDGTELLLKTLKRGWSSISIKVVDVEARKLAAKNRAAKKKELKKKLRALSKSDDVKNYLKALEQLAYVINDEMIYPIKNWDK